MGESELTGGPSWAADSDTWNRRIEAEVGRRLSQLRPTAHRIGRFTILEHLGDGGMGAVYAAYDEQLDRKVAIKVLGGHELPNEDELRRFQREAMALARLSHPNVVTIHEVGEHQGELFLAMEQVRGEDLAHWLQTEPAWPQVLDAFVQAGRGLVAAHEAGIVHRDLKPHNLMRSDDGVVKVVDFGLASVEAGDLDETMERGSLNTVVYDALTLPGRVMGTPAYMSPEQHCSTAVDTPSDQYSYCVALWQGLVGALPFVAESLNELHERKLAGPPPWPDSAPAIPHRIVEALRRGLQPEAHDRWPSMVPLLDALSFDPGQRRNRRQRWLTGAGLLGLGALTTWGLLDPRAVDCTGAERALAGIWDDSRRAEVEATMLGIDTPYSTAVWEHTRQRLDTYAEQWVTAHTRTCEATAQGEQSPRMLDLKMACLQRAAQRLTATVDTLAAADVEVLDTTRDLVAGLSALARCEDAEVLAAEVEPPLPEDAQAVDIAFSHLARAESLVLVGRYDDSAQALEAARQTLEGVDYGPIATHVALHEGILLNKQDQYDASEASLSEALELASRWKQHELMAKAARWLMQVIGASQNRTDAGIQYWRMAYGLSEGHPLWEAGARDAYGVVLLSAGRYDEAEQQLRAAYQLKLDVLGPDEPELTVTRNNLVSILFSLQRWDEAVVELREILARELRDFGPDHPFVMRARANIAAVLAMQGQYEGAAAEFEIVRDWRRENLGPDHLQTAWLQINFAECLLALHRTDEAERNARQGLAIIDKALGSEHAKVGNARGTLASVLKAQGKYEEAEAQFRAALAVLRKTLGPEHADVGRNLANFGALLADRKRGADAELHLREALSIHLSIHGPGSAAVATGRANLAAIIKLQGRLEEAEAVMRVALEETQQALGGRHPSVARVQHMLGDALYSQKKLEEAESIHRDALALRLELFDSDHTVVADSRFLLASVLLDLGRTDEAVALAEQAWSKRQRGDSPRGSRANVAFLLGRALWSASPPARDRARARTLAKDALRSYSDAGEAFEERAERVQRWLDGHVLPSR
ncbi:MAG: serine/threonine-protein kinase [Deltaproteobacteria bacterium]|nr:serine/threonine-protein kinase [Deltaproteobacteria bacterium]